jgi:hypothetical protein
VNGVEKILRAELRPELASGAAPDWGEVAARAGLNRSRARRRRWSLALAFAFMAVVLGLATPLGAALARELDGFSAWLSGQPGEPAGSEQQREFDAENARSWIGFPAGTELRRLVVRRIAGGTVELDGFRPGPTRFCLRLTVTGATRATRTGCAPLYELRQTGAPVRLVMVDVPVGVGEKRSWNGINEIRSFRLQITAGISADGVRAVVLDDEDGIHRVPAVANSFLYVAEEPGVGQRVREVSAVTANGAVSVPFVPIASARPTPALAAPAPPIARTVSSGRIGWLDGGEARGEPLTALPAPTRADLPGARPGRIVSGRVLTPDPDRSERMVLTLDARRGSGAPARLCTLLVPPGGGGGGCAVYPGVFEHGPVSVSVSGNGADEFVTLYGLASDDVARIDALLPDGRHVEVPLADNAFIVDVARSRLPARLVAYDSEDRVIGSSEPLADFNGWPGPARGRVTLLRAAGPDGAHFELLVGPASDGGECVYLRRYIDARHAGTGIQCNPRTPQDWPLEVETDTRAGVLTGGVPMLFLGGRVRSDVETIRVVFADGTHQDLRATRGYVLYATPEDRLDTAHAPIRAEARNAHGQVLQTVHVRLG